METRKNVTSLPWIVGEGLKRCLLRERRWFHQEVWTWSFHVRAWWLGHELRHGLPVV